MHLGSTPNFGTKKMLLVLQPKRIFLCSKENNIWFKTLLLYLKDPLLKSKDPVLTFSPRL